jgi:hypothetical protein
MGIVYEYFTGWVLRFVVGFIVFGYEVASLL